MNSNSEKIYKYIAQAEYQKALGLAEDLQNIYGKYSLPFFYALIYCYLLTGLYLFFGAAFLLKWKRIILRGIPTPKTSWDDSYSIIWGTYWQNLRGALNYNLATCKSAPDERTFYLSLAFTFYSLAFMGSPLAIKAFSKLIENTPESCSDLKKNLYLWLGVVYQMNAFGEEGEREYDLFEKAHPNAEPFLKLISKATSLTVNICEKGPEETSIALEACFKVTSGFDSNRSHIQLFGAKATLLALEGDFAAGELFIEKSKKAAALVGNTIDKVIYNRVATLFYVVRGNYELASHHLKTCEESLKRYAPVLSYQHEIKKLKMIIEMNSPFRFIRESLSTKLVFYLRSVLHPKFRKKLILRLKERFGGLPVNPFYWDALQINQYLVKRIREENRVEVGRSIRETILSLDSAEGSRDSEDFAASVRRIGQTFGSSLSVVGPNVSSVFAQLPIYVQSRCPGTFQNSDANGFKQFIDNHGFLIIQTIGNESSGIPTLSYAMLFPAINAHNIEAIDFAVKLSVNHLFAVKAATEKTRSLLELESIRQKSNLAAQVAHDIRSPLAALSTIEGDLLPLKEEARGLIRHAIGRISDIANQLIRSSREDGRERVSETKVILVSALVESIVREKQVHYRSKPGITIVSNYASCDYGSFIEVDPIELERVLSNLVNNSVEAIEEIGKIEVLITKYEDSLVIAVHDNGKGIPLEVLKHLGVKGCSVGKPEGMGLGLFHARVKMQEWGGSLQIDSSLQIGTTVSLKFPLKRMPSWFVEKIEMTPTQNVVVLDDDASIHGVWDARFSPYRAKVQVTHLATPAQFKNWISNQRSLQPETLFLFDYEFAGFDKNGMSLIRENGLEKNAIIVTSRSEESHLIKQCEGFNIRMIPKGLASRVPIEFVSASNVAR